MQTECSATLFEFEAVERRAVVAGFDGGNITSNAGALLLGQVDRGLGLVRRFARCFTDRRDARYVEHRIETLVGQRIFGLVLGDEDLNDHDELRKDPTFAVLAGKLHSVLRSDCEALAGKSTLNRLEHTPRRCAGAHQRAAYSLRHGLGMPQQGRVRTCAHLSPARVQLCLTVAPYPPIRTPMLPAQTHIPNHPYSGKDAPLRLCIARTK